MKIINNKEEFDNFYYYKDSKRTYPKKYPCLVDMVNEDCGIMGDCMRHYVLYFPNTKDAKEAFLLGLKAKWISLD